MAKKGKPVEKAPRLGDKPFHYVQLRCFAHATEDRDKVRHALAQAAGFSPDDPESAKRFAKCLTESHSEGHFRNPITILEAQLTRAADVRRFWDRLLAVDAIAPRLSAELGQRLDDDLVFWIRLDKQAAHGGVLRLTSGEDVVQVRAKLATYPKDRTVGLAFLHDFIGAAAQRADASVA